MPTTRPSPLPILLFGAVAALVTASGCTGTSGEQDSGEPGDLDSGQPDGDGIDVYVAGISKTSGQVQVRIDAATPSPPDRGDNSWTLSVMAADGAPLANAAVEVQPWMPAHGHGSDAATGVETDVTGTYEAGPFDLFMPGLWEISVVVEDAEGTEEDVAFRFEIEG